ncbi:MAG: hypothetical protein L3J63_02205 [Geopsychrobacter sp.]|nr:hypothetical protein [Geopsychrobacter sp.]
MTLVLGGVAVLWGLLAGYLLLRCTESLLGLVCCVHGLFARRWKTLIDKNATGLIRPGLIIKPGLRFGVYALLAGFLLDAGDDFVRRTYHLSYTATPGILFGLAGTVLFLGRLRTSVRRLKLVWRMSHEFDFAARRERTQRLKG